MAFCEHEAESSTMPLNGRSFLDQLKKLLASRPPVWTLEREDLRANQALAHLKSETGEVVVQVTQAESEEDAVTLLQQISMRVMTGPQEIADLGDEALIWPGSEAYPTSMILFRKGDAVGQINATAEDICRNVANDVVSLVQ